VFWLASGFIVSGDAAADVVDVVPLPSSTPQPSQEPVVTPAPEPVVTPEPVLAVDTSNGEGYEEIDKEYAAYQQIANDVLLYGRNGNTTYGGVGLGNESISESSPYPWERYGYNNSAVDERGVSLSWMWTPEKFRTVANSEAERYMLYNAWVEARTPHHEVTGSVSLYDSTGRLILQNQPIKVGTRASAIITLNNNLAGDVIGYIDYDVKLYRFNGATGCLDLMYDVTNKDSGPVAAGIVPGKPWTHKIVSDVPILPGRWMGIIKIYNHLDNVLLCEIRTGEYDAAFLNSDGSWSFG
jgi:hypothetical protein